MGKKSFYKEFKSNPELLPEIEEFIINIIKETPIPADKLSCLALSVSEASSNAIIHGNHGDDTKLVKVTVNIEESKAEIIFKDEGTGFEPSDVPDPTDAENIFKDHGRGIHIMKSYLDDLYYDFKEDGTETVLVMSF